MSIWCYTNYTFMGKENEIKDFYNKIKSFTSKERISNDFGTTWLGNIVNGFGFDWRDVSCQGYISYLSCLKEDTNNERFSLATQSSWKPKNKMWDKIIEKYYPSITYNLIAEEPGLKYFRNTDLAGNDFSVRFKVDFKLPASYEFECSTGFYADCEEDVVETFNSIFHRKYKSFKQCKKRLSKEFKRKKYRNKGYFIAIHKYRESI